MTTRSRRIIVGWSVWLSRWRATRGVHTRRGDEVGHTVPMFRKLAVLAVVVLVTFVQGPVAVARQRPTVSVVPGPSSFEPFAEECSDTSVPVETVTSFVLERTGDTGDALTVSYETSGSAVAGEDYKSLPGEATFGPGESSITLEVEVLRGDSQKMVNLQLRVIDDETYSVGTAQEALITFVRPRDPSLPRPECGFYFAEGQHIERTVEVGDTPERVVVEQLSSPLVVEVPAGGYRAEVTRGSLPPGLTLGADGRFQGRAATAGAYEATVEACRTTPPGTCITTTLAINVIGASSPPSVAAPTTSSSAPGTQSSLPATTPTLPATGVPVVGTGVSGVLLVCLGLMLTVVARTRRATPR